MKRNRRLANRLTLYFALTVTIPLLISGTIFGFGFAQFSQQAVSSRQASVVEVGRVYINNYFDNIFEEMNLMVGFINTGDSSWKPAIETVCQRSTETYLSISFVAGDGNEIARFSNCETVQNAPLANRSREEAFFRAQRGEIYVRNISFNENNEPITTISMPAKTSDGQDVVILADVDLGSIWVPLNALEVGDGGYLYVVDQRGNLIGYRDPTVVRQEKNLAALPSIAPLLVGQTNVSAEIYSGLTGENVIGSSTTITRLNWVLVLEQPTSQVFAARNALGILLIGILIVFALIAVIIAALVARSIVTPIQKLAESAEAVGQGDLNKEVHVNTGDEIEVTANAFNQMTTRLRQTLSGLEERIAERTHDAELSKEQSEKRAQDLQTISEVSRVISAEQDSHNLLPLIAQLVSDKFSFYHVGIFLIDNARKYAVLQATNSEGGKRMLMRGHRLGIGQTGLVGNVAQTGKARIALDVGVDATYFNNPDLPETRSEIALPLNVRGNTIGILDVQSTESNAFSASDITILSVLTDQIAVAIENTRLFTETRLALTSAERTYQQFIAQEWKRASQTLENIGYRSVDTNTNPLDAPVQANEIKSAIERGTPVIVSDKKGQSVIAIPIKLRNQVVGVLNVRSRDKGRTWDDEELTLVRSIAERASLALENARLIQDSQRRAAKERLIGEIANKISLANSIQNIFETAAKELGQALNSADITVQLSTTEEKE